MFETFALPRPPRRNWLAGPAAVLLHAAAFGAFIAAAIWENGDIGQPAIRVPIGIFAGPSAPRGQRDSAGEVRAVRPNALSRRLPPAQPTSTPASFPPSRLAPQDGLDSQGGNSRDGFPDGGSDGKSDGIPGSEGQDPLAGSDAISANNPDVVPPRLVFQPQPEYPEMSRRTREQGIVVLEAVIGLDGKVEQVSILRGSSALLDAAAVRALREWRYTPATLNGRPVRVFLTATVRFLLH